VLEFDAERCSKHEARIAGVKLFDGLGQLGLQVAVCIAFEWCKDALDDLPQARGLGHQHDDELIAHRVPLQLRMQPADHV
jgi:hypothetical protein